MDIINEERAKLIKKELEDFELDIKLRFKDAEFVDGFILNVNMEDIGEEVLEEYNKKYNYLRMLIESRDGSLTHK